MTKDKLSEVHQARPFQPFRIHLADGRALEVRHPEFLAVSPIGKEAVLFNADGRHEIIDLPLVTAIEVGTRPRPRRHA